MEHPKKREESYSEEYKVKVLKEYRRGKKGINEISYEHKLPRPTLKGWIDKSDKELEMEKLKRALNNVSTQEEELTALRKSLSDAHIKLNVYESMLKIAEKEYGVDVKKNLSTAELERIGRKKS